jgi:hypothetical protein
MKILNVTWLIVVMIIIALGGIVVTAGAPLLFVQLASATDVTTTTMGGQGVGEEGTNTDSTTNNISNAVLSRLFSFGEGVESNVNPINETHIVVSYLGNRIIMPPNATTDVVINSTETGNLTVNVLPNGLSIEQGQGFIVTEEDGAAAEEEEENATVTFVSLSRTNPDGTGSGTSVAFFRTNSTGRLAFLDNMIAIGQTEFSLEEGISRFAEWEWKGADLPFGDKMTNATTTAADINATTATSEEEGEGNQEGEDPNEFENCVIPPGMDPGDVGC